jgi:murein L,D-transpeptidase YafK
MQGKLSPRGQRTVGEVLRVCGPKARVHFLTACNRAKIAYPPQRVTLLVFKEEKQLEVWAGNATGKLHRIGSYPVLAASGTTGPKRREGDQQVPEGFYRITVLNPNSRFHLSLRVDYPNAEDIAHAIVPPEQMGGDIYVHGNAVSIGCVAIGDPGIEEVFALVAQAKTSERRIWICPNDLRTQNVPTTTDPWLRDLYRRLKIALRRYPK